MCKQCHVTNEYIYIEDKTTLQVVEIWIYLERKMNPQNVRHRSSPGHSPGTSRRYVEVGVIVNLALITLSSRNALKEKSVLHIAACKFD